MMRQGIFTLAIVCALLAPLIPAEAVSVESWSVSTAEGFASGSVDGTAIDPAGSVRLAPPLRTLWGPAEGIVWAVQPAGNDGAFVALSGPGRVLRVAHGLPAVTLYETPEEGLVTAMVPDAGDSVYVGVAPRGEVLQIGPAGGATVVADPVAAFVWALAREQDGTLWIGTGLPGALLRVRRGEEPETWFESGDDPVRCLATLPGGGVVLGTGGRGRVIRVSPDGRAFVIYDAEESEIVSVAVTADGTIYALAANGQKQPSAVGAELDEAPEAEGGMMRVVVTPAGGNGENGATADPAPAPAPRPQAARFRSPPGGTVYRLDPDGSARGIWDTGSEMPFAMSLAPDEGLFVATGDKGRIWHVDAEGRASLLLRIPSNQASALARGSGGGLLVGGTTDARVELLGAGPRERGSYLGPPIDAGSVADWGSVRWSAEQPRGTTLRIRARSGNTDQPDDTWSPWVALPEDADGVGEISELPAARWLQLRADFKSAKGASPSLTWLEARYLPRNRAPEVERLSVEPAGVVWLRGQAQSSNRTGPLVADDPVSRGVAAGLQRGSRPGGALRKAYEAGAHTFSWKASDPDGDRLRFALEIRREGEANWFPLVADLGGEFFSWDGRSLPDGRYRVRLVADDSADNAAGSQRSAMRISDLFLVDNTRPTIGEPEVKPDGDGWSLSFVARDPGGYVAAGEVSFDGEGWRPLAPADGVADSREERFEISVPVGDSAASGGTVWVRVADSAGNLGGAMWTIP